MLSGFQKLLELFLRTTLNKKYFFLGGVPRSGSTIILSIMAQNPDFYVSGTTVVCEALWSNYKMLSTNIANRSIISQNKIEYKKTLMKSVIDSYYSDVKNKYIIDKNRFWTLPGNRKMLEEYIEENPKIIVMTRSAEEVLKSYMKIYKINNVPESDSEIFDKFFQKNYYAAEDYFKSYAGLMSSYLTNENLNYCFIDYHDFVENPFATMYKIYNFFGLNTFNHNFNNIKKPFEENDLAWGLNKLHDIRDNLQIEDNEIILPEYVIEKCKEIDKIVSYSKNGKNLDMVYNFIEKNI
jgi:sulfotransferase